MLRRFFSSYIPMEHSRVSFGALGRSSRGFDSRCSNEATSDENTALDGAANPGRKTIRFTLGKTFIIAQKATDYHLG